MAAVEELSSWIRLTQTPGVGQETARKLLAAFGLPERVFEAELPALTAVVSERVARALLAAPSTDTLALIERTLRWTEQPGNRVLTLADGQYPASLLNIPDPPVMLYMKGRCDLPACGNDRAVAVVGSRNATAQGVLNAEKFSEALSHAGLTIVSGMALGIDTAAHTGGLRGAGSTIAVIGTGIDIVYPARNRVLAHQIAAAGCIVSEYPLGLPAIAANFPRRNRIISGLARAVLVVEAAAQSGSLITARMAAEQGRDVFAIPGSIHSPLSKGCHLLIKQGAKLVESAQDVLEELPDFQAACVIESAPLPFPASEEHDPVLHAMGFDPVALDMLAQRIDTDIASISAQLLTLELEGKVEALQGGAYRRIG